MIVDFLELLNLVLGATMGTFAAGALFSRRKYQNIWWHFALMATLSLFFFINVLVSKEIWHLHEAAFLQSWLVLFLVMCLHQLNSATTPKTSWFIAFLTLVAGIVVVTWLPWFWLAHLLPSLLALFYTLVSVKELWQKKEKLFSGHRRHAVFQVSGLFLVISLPLPFLVFLGGYTNHEMIVWYSALWAAPTFLLFCYLFFASVDFLDAWLALIPLKAENSLTQEELQVLEKRFHQQLNIHRLYQKSALSVKEFALACSLPVNQVSWYINIHKGKSFRQFINSYRLAEAKELLASSDLLVMQICYQVGFNSKASFYRIFQEEVGQSPAEFAAQKRGKT